MVRLSLRCGVLIALGFAAFPIASIASCVPGDIAESSQPTESDDAAFYSIVVMRCRSQPKNNGHVTFLGPPQPEPNTSILALSIPFGSLPPATYDSKLLALFDDFTRAIYQSEWNLEDVY